MVLVRVMLIVLATFVVGAVAGSLGVNAVLFVLLGLPLIWLAWVIVTVVRRHRSSAVVVDVA